MLSGRVSRSRSRWICSAGMSAAAPGAPRSRARVRALPSALDDQLANEFRQRGEDMQDQPPAMASCWICGHQGQSDRRITGDCRSADRPRIGRFRDG